MQTSRYMKLKGPKATLTQKKITTKYLTIKMLKIKDKKRTLREEKNHLPCTKTPIHEALSVFLSKICVSQDRVGRYSQRIKGKKKKKKTSTKNAMPGKSALQKQRDKCIAIQKLREFLQFEMDTKTKTYKSINSPVEINIEVKFGKLY